MALSASILAGAIDIVPLGISPEYLPASSHGILGSRFDFALAINLYLVLCSNVRVCVWARAVILELSFLRMAAHLSELACQILFPGLCFRASVLFSDTY